MRYPWPAVRPLSLIQGQTEPGAIVPPAGGCVQPTIGAMWALMIQTEPESVPLKSACGAPIAMSGSPSPVMSPTAATVMPACAFWSAGKSTWKKYG